MNPPRPHGSGPQGCQPPHGPGPQSPHQYPFGYPPQPEPQGLGTGTKVALGGAALGTAFLVLAAVAAFVRVPSDGTPTAQDDPSIAATDEEADPDDAAPNEGSAEGDSTDESADDEPEGPGTPPDFPEHDVLEASGSGDTLVEVEPSFDDVRIISMTHEGSDVFSLYAGGSDSDSADLVATKRSPYEGRMLLTTIFEDDIGMLKIEADGDWEVAIEPLTHATPWRADESEYSDSGDDVLQLLWSTGNFASLSLYHEGDRYFSVKSLAGDSSDYMANELGAYEGEEPLQEGADILEVGGDGEWTLTR
ncbi:hypothetical protein [Nocardiopsis nanhaiensis]